MTESKWIETKRGEIRRVMRQDGSLYILYESVENFYVPGESTFQIGRGLCRQEWYEEDTPIEHWRKTRKSGSLPHTAVPRYINPIEHWKDQHGL